MMDAKRSKRTLLVRWRGDQCGSCNALKALSRQLKSRFDRPKVVFPLLPHDPSENGLGETQDTMRQEKSTHGKPGAASSRCHLPFEAHV